MHGFKRLTVIGDSYCAQQIAPTDWPIYLGMLLGVPSIGKGSAGNAWWSSRRNLINDFSDDTKNTLLIVVHTHPDRLPNDYEIPSNKSVLWPKDHPNSSIPNILRIDPLGETIIAGEYFYKSKLFSLDFYEWAQQAWIKELDDNADNFFKVIHIPAFAETKVDVKNSIVVRPSSTAPSLFSLTYAENPSSAVDGVKSMIPDTRRNHFNTHNNIKLAEALAKIITDTDQSYVGEVNFSNLDRWDLKNNWR
jgi:hypothetical protein